MNKPIQRVTSLGTETVELLKKSKIMTCGQVYQYSEIFLAQKLDLSVYDIRDLLVKVSEYVSPKRVTSWDLYQHKKNMPSSLATRLAQLDSSLKGGIPAGTVTELVGHAGAGKTQMCLTLAALVTMPSISAITSMSLGDMHDADAILSNGTVVYIDTEQKFNAKRLYEIVMERVKSDMFYQNMSNVDTVVGSGGGAAKLALSEKRLEILCRKAVEQVVVFTLPSCKDVVERLSNIQRLIIEKNVRLLLVDSVAAVARQE